MQDINVLLYVESRYKVNRRRIRDAVVRTIASQQIASPVEVSIAVVGDRKMATLNKKYRNKEGTTNVLSFPIGEGDTMVVPADIMRLGDVVISYPMVIQEAAKEEMLVDDRVDQLVEHGVLHLLGIHH